MAIGARMEKSSWVVLGNKKSNAHFFFAAMLLLLLLPLLLVAVVVAVVTAKTEDCTERHSFAWCFFPRGDRIGEQNGPVRNCSGAIGL